MDDKKRSIIYWIKEHKEELMLAGVSTVVLILVILGIENHNDFFETWSSLIKSIDKSQKSSDIKAGNVGTDYSIDDSNFSFEKDDRLQRMVLEHVRNLPEGWKASPNKVVSALDHGFMLLPNQTWVESYSTGGSVA